MAVFNPQVNPVNPQSYLDWSKVIEGPLPDQSKGIALKTAAEGIGNLPSIADKFMQGIVKNDTTEAVDAIRDIHIQGLQAATQPQEVIPQPAATASGKAVEKPSLMDSNASMDVPSPVQAGLNRAATLSAAQQGGKVNDTLYTQQMYSLAKNLRAQYPNYRPYIDETISQMTGFNPANAYATNMLQDLNQQRTSAKQELDHTLNKLQTYAGYKTTDGITMSQMYDYAKTNGTAAIPVINKWLDQVASTEVNAKLKTAVITSENQDTAQRKEQAEAGFTKLSSDMVANHFYANTVTASLNTPQKIAERITEEGLYPGTYSAQDMEAAGRMLKSKRDTMEQKLLSEAAKPIIDPSTNKPAVDKNGNTYSYLSLNGSEKTQQIIKQSLRPYDISVDGALNDKTGTATYAATHAQRAREDQDNKIISDPTNEAMTKLDWMNKRLGPQLTDTIIKQALLNDVDDKVKNWFTDKTKNMIMGTDYKQGLIQPTFKQDIEDAKKGATTGKPLAPNTKVYDALADNIHFLIDPEMDDASKIRTAKYYFSPEGREVLNNFKQGYRDEKGNWIPGREAVWQTLTNRTVTDEIARLGKLPGGQEIAKNYKDWMESEFSSSLFRPEINNLNDLPTYTTPTTKGMRVVDVSSKVHIGWVNKEGGYKFMMLDDKDRPMDIDYANQGSVKVPRHPGEQAALQGFQQSLDRLNTGIENLGHMEKSMGGDVNAYLMDVFHRFGFQPDKNAVGLTGKLAEAVKNSSKQAMKIQDVFKNVGKSPAQSNE